MVRFHVPLPRKESLPQVGSFFLSAIHEASHDLASKASVDREFVRQSHAQMLASSMAADAVSRAPVINVVSVFYDK